MLMPVRSSMPLMVSHTLSQEGPMRVNHTLKSWLRR